LLPLEISRLMPLETLQILGQVGAIEEFAPLPKTLDDGAELKIWQYGNDKTITCTIVRTLGKGAQGVVYEVTSDLVADNKPRAVKCAKFSAATREMLVLLRLNSPYTQAGSNVQSLSHRNVLRIDSVWCLLIDHLSVFIDCTLHHSYTLALTCSLAYTRVLSAYTHTCISLY
jgi:hypothetical protein